MVAGGVFGVMIGEHGFAIFVFSVFFLGNINAVDLEKELQFTAYMQLFGERIWHVCWGEYRVLQYLLEVCRVVKESSQLNTICSTTFLES